MENRVRGFGLKLAPDGGVAMPLKDVHGRLHDVKFIARDGGTRRAGRVQARTAAWVWALMHVIDPGRRAGKDAIVVAGDYLSGAAIHKATRLPVGGGGRGGQDGRPRAGAAGTLSGRQAGHRGGQGTGRIPEGIGRGNARHPRRSRRRRVVRGKGGRSRQNPRCAGPSRRGTPCGCAGETPSPSARTVRRKGCRPAFPWRTCAGTSMSWFR